MRKAYLTHLSALLLFGSNGIVASLILLNSYEIVLLRSLIGGLFLILVFVLTRGRLSIRGNRTSFAFLLLSGAAMGASWMFLYEAYARIGVGLATLANYCGPVIVMALAPITLGERLTATKILGFAAVVTGMLLVNREALLAGGLSWGLVCGLMSAVLYAGMILFNKKAVGFTGLENTVCQLAAAFVVTAVFTSMKQGLALSVPREGILPILFLGVVNTGIGCYLYFSSIQQLPAQSVALCGYLEPISALAFSALFLQERLTPLQMAGAALVLGGAAFGECFGRRRAAATP